MVIDATVAAGAFTLAILLGSGGTFPEVYAHNLPILLLLVSGIKTSVCYAVGGPRRMWHYTSVQDALVLTAGGAISSGILFLLSLTGLIAVSLSILLIDAALYLHGGFSVRLARRVQASLAKKHTATRGDVVEEVRTLMVGAGDTASSIMADLENHPNVGWKIVGLVDDDPTKQGAKLRGHPVIGSTAQLEHLIDSHNIGLVVIAMPSQSPTVLRTLIRRAEERGAVVRVVSPLAERMGNGKPARVSLPATLADLVDAVEVKKMLLSRIRRNRRQDSILVTGGAGYIGYHVVRKLLDRGYRVRVLDNFMYGASAIESLQVHTDLEILKGDISSIRDVVSAAKDVDRVIALAAIVGDPACSLNAEETLNLNYESTKVLVEACNFYGVRRLVFASSCSVYGASDNGLLTETSPLNPVSLYARTRVMSENVIFERAGNTVPVALRLSTVFGLSPRMRFDLVVNALTAQAVVDGRIRITGGGQWRPFVHCQDAAEAFILAATAPAEAVDREVFNVGAESMNYTIAQVGAIVAEEVANGVNVELAPGLDDPRNYRVSSAKIADALGFEHRYDLRAGISEMIAAIRNKPELRNYEHAAYSNIKLLDGRFSGAFTTQPQTLLKPRSRRERRSSVRRRVAVFPSQTVESRHCNDRRCGADRRMVRPAGADSVRAHTQQLLTPRESRATVS